MERLSCRRRCGLALAAAWAKNNASRKLGRLDPPPGRLPYRATEPDLKEKNVSIEIGQHAPDVSLPRDGGGTVSLGDFAGKTVVLYFYPKDDTSGCTKQAIAFSEHADAFREAGAVVIGVSKDSVASHTKFVAKHDLGIILASDAEGDVCERFGTWVEKSMYGRKYMGIDRSTFLIDGTGAVRQIWRKVKVPGHAEEVLAAVRTL
jgi:thioredoxin-dependent peroxiredoxin